MLWDFFTLRPETIHEVMYLNSDIGIPDGYRHMDAFSANTFQLVNANGEVFFCKFNYKVCTFVVQAISLRKL